MPTQDTEITLGTGKMLALFFGLVIVCAAFFGVGFSVGRNSTRTAMLSADSITGNPLARAAAVRRDAAPTDPAALYKPAADQDPTLPPSATVAQSAPSSAPPVAEAAAKSAPPDPLATPNSSGYYVQVAAVSKPDDAEALVSALKKKQYSAFAANNSSTDKLFHVQVGPFFDIKDAEATRAKLISDGYNPILKK